MTTQVVSQVQCIGDSMNTTGYKMRLLIGQKGDLLCTLFGYACDQAWQMGVNLSGVSNV
jgi:hypothetical protein